MEEELRKQIRENILDGGTWLRAFFMILYAIICYFAILITAIVVLIQFGFVLVSGQTNDRLLPAGKSLSIYIYQIFNFLTYNSDEKPFPITNWPSVEEFEDDTIIDLPKEAEPPQKN
ncbi:MAG: DUF4389 domain-containing protein [Thiomargarita sp.]|nr:DUF4389 domain-containing protein [Thiomargarita sp.]